MLLANKVAVIYGGGGSIGGAVARNFAREGATVFLAGRKQASLNTVANDILAQGGNVFTTVVDALDAQAVNQFVDSIISQVGHLDITFNVIGYGDIQQPLMELTVDDFLQPVTIATRAQFITTQSAAHYMMKQKSGVILHFGGGGPQTIAGIGGFKIAFDAIESLRRQWALELGEYGIRVVTLKTGGIPETIPADMPGRETIIESLLPQTLLKRTATLADVGQVAAFIASDMANTITSTEINISCGAIVD